MHDNPIFSFLIANYNNRKYAGELLDSLISQTFPSWEAIIVDDGSPDGGIADIVASKNDTRIHYFANNENAGAGKTRNDCIKYAVGQYQAIIDADDILHPDYLKEMLKQFEEDDALEIAYVDLRYFGSRREQNFVQPYPLLQAADLADKQWIPHCGCCMKKETMRAGSGYYEGYELRHGNIDWDFFLSIAEKTSFRATRIPLPLYLYRQHEQNMSKSRSPHEFETREIMYARHRDFLDGLGKGPSFLASGYYESAAANWVVKNYSKAVELALKGINLLPLAVSSFNVMHGSLKDIIRLVATLEKKFDDHGSGAFAATSENLENRIRLASGYAAIGKWEQAENCLFMALGSAYGAKALDVSAWLSYQLSLLYRACGQDMKAREAAELSIICNPVSLDGLRQRIELMTPEKEANLSLTWFMPWQDKEYYGEVISLMPILGLLASRLGKTTEWFALRLSETSSVKQPILPLDERVYATDIGRRIIWEFRAKDLYEKYGHQVGDDLLRQAIDYVRPKSILEIGCGNGRNLAFFSCPGVRCIGQDISSSAIELARKRALPGVELVNRPLAEIKWPAEHFELVVCNRVLQHLSPDELPEMLDQISSLGRFIYVNESLPESLGPESWYLKKYDLVGMLEERGMDQVKDLYAPRTEAMLFRNRNI